MNQPNKVDPSSAAEVGEGRPEAKKNSSWSHMPPTQSGKRMSQGWWGVREAAVLTLRRHSSEAGAVCVSCARTDLCGGRSVMIVPSATRVNPTPTQAKIEECFILTYVSSRPRTAEPLEIDLMGLAVPRALQNLLSLVDHLSLEDRLLDFCPVDLGLRYLEQVMVEDEQRRRELPPRPPWYRSVLFAIRQLLSSNRPLSDNHHRRE